MSDRFNDAEELLAIHLAELRIGFEREVEFYVGRKWRLDFTFKQGRYNWAVECNGGKYTGGHRRGDKVDDEYEKLNRAAVMGYRVLQFTREQVLSGYAKDWIRNNVLQ